MASNSKGVVSFIFDDASRSHNGWVAPFFESRDVLAGFAVAACQVETDWQLGLTAGQMLALQGRGHEFLCHGKNHLSLADPATPIATVEAEIIDGLKDLRALGLKISAFVAPNSAMHAGFVTPRLRSYYHYGFTVYGPDVAQAVQALPYDPHRLRRTSLHLAGLAGAKQAIDAAVESDGLVVFYDHDPLQTDYANSMHYSELSQLVDYAIAAGVSILPPSAALAEAEKRAVNRH